MVSTQISKNINLKKRQDTKGLISSPIFVAQMGSYLYGSPLPSNSVSSSACILYHRFLHVFWFLVTPFDDHQTNPFKFIIRGILENIWEDSLVTCTNSNNLMQNIRGNHNLKSSKKNIKMNKNNIMIKRMKFL